MIVWINGAFGSGKSTTAGLVVEMLDRAKLFDPEYVGYMLMPFVESPTGDFQDLPLWRHLVIETMTGLVQEYPHPWVAPMSLINAAYRAEILGGIRDGGVEVRKIFHKLRSQAIEPFNGLFKNVFEWRVKMPVKGLQRSQLLALGAVVVYQLVLFYQHEQNLPLGKGIKSFLRAA